jgi:hypothetical protein
MQVVVIGTCEVANYKWTYIDAFSNNMFNMEENTQFELMPREYVILIKK